MAGRDEYTWALTPHCCRVCFSRVLVRETFDRRRVYRCAGCGVEQEGRSEAAICCCGLKLKTGVDAGIRCVVSQDRTPEFPQEITAALAVIPNKTAIEAVYGTQKTRASTRCQRVFCFSGAGRALETE